MALKELRQLVAGGESTTVEFKRKVAYPEKIVKEIVAFANTKGGNLLIGVDDNGNIPGLKTAEEDSFALTQAIDRYCRPPIKYNSEIIPISTKKAIVNYTIFESDNKPHFVVPDSKEKRKTGYIRIEDKSIQASREMKEILKRGRKAKDIRFRYGDKEQILMRYLRENSFITLDHFSKIAGIRRYLASRTLVLLVLANVLKIIPREIEDYYTLQNLPE